MQVVHPLELQDHQLDGSKRKEEKTEKTEKTEKKKKKKKKEKVGGRGDRLIGGRATFAGQRAFG